MGRRMQLDATGRCRSTATSRDIDDRIPPSNGRRYPADPARVQQIVAVMGAAVRRRRAFACAA